MKKWVLLIGFLLACSISAQAELGKSFSFWVSWDEGHYEISDVSVVMDFPLEIDENGNYLVKLVDESGKTLYQHKTKRFSMELRPSRIAEPEEITEIGEEGIVIDYDELLGTKKGQMFFLLPYIEKARWLSFEHGKNVLARADLSALCNSDGKCREPENYLSCPADCSLDKKDAYCLAFRDGTCDPDCVEGIDPDCKEGIVKPVELNYGQIAIVAAIAIVLVLIFYSRRRK